LRTTDTELGNKAGCVAHATAAKTITYKISRPHGWLFNGVGKVGKIEAALIAQDTKRTHTVGCSFGWDEAA
jgi:hypothetical protein